MKATQTLHEHGQSLWLDNITRGLLVLDDERAPDFARLVEIHRNPGYDRPAKSAAATAASGTTADRRAIEAIRGSSQVLASPTHRNLDLYA